MSSKPDRMTFQARFNSMMDTLRQDILTSALPAGEYIPSELMLAEQYQLSRKSVRKGLDTLVDEGLITKVPRVGNMVNAPEAFQTLTVRLGYYPSLDQEAVFRELLEQFHRAYPHIKVETISLPYRNYMDSVRGFLENGWLDVISLNQWDFADTAERDACGLFEPQEPSPEHYSFLAPSFTHDGKMLVQPFVFSPVVLCYNKNMYRQLGIPEPDSSWSWSYLSDICLKLQSEFGILGLYADIASVNRFTIALLQKNFQFERAATVSGYSIDDPLLWESLHIFRDLISTQGAPPSFLSEAAGDTERLFLQQKTAMILTTHFGMAYLKDAPFDYDIAPLPYETSAKTLLLAVGFAVNRQSKEKEAAKLLVDFLTSAESQLQIRQRTLSIPAHKKSAEWTAASGAADPLNRPSRFLTYREIVPTFRSTRDLNITTAALDRLHSELKLFWSNLEQPESVIERWHGQKAVTTADSGG